MKDIKNYNAEKYEKEPGKFKRIEEGIYECEEDGDIIYVTSLSFVQEPEFGAMDLEDIVSLRGIIGKHVYNAEYEKDGQIYVKLVIE